MTLPRVNSGVFGRIRRRVSKQAYRGLSIYVFCCALVVLVLSQLSSYHTVPANKPSELVRRTSYEYQSTLATGAFPRKIWQSWKVDPLDFEERDLTCARSWVTKNPDYRYEVLTDSNDVQYVEEHFGPDGLNRPDIVHVYRSLTAKIIKADLLRYLVMYVEGGLYVDIDVEALKPIDRFIPDKDRFREQDIDMIIGVEIDEPQFADHPILGPKAMSFCQWTFMCKPRLPVMLHLVENIINWLYEVSEQQGVPISEISLNFDDVISGTGPSAFTDAVLAEMSKREKKEVTWEYFHNMDESRLVGGVLVLTVEAFAAGQGHSDSGTHNSRNALVKHHYHASGWPTLHPRYKHPVYGEVEACNWDPECVKLWDFSKAAFEALPPEEQERQIAEKEAAEQALMLEEQAMPGDFPGSFDLAVELPPPQPEIPELPEIPTENQPPEPVPEPAQLKARHLKGPPPQPLINTVAPSNSILTTVSPSGSWKPNTVASFTPSPTASVPKPWWKPKPSVSSPVKPSVSPISSWNSKPNTVASTVTPTVSQPWWKPKPNTVASAVTSASVIASVTVSPSGWWKPKPKPNTVASSIPSSAPSVTVSQKPNTVVSASASQTVSQPGWWKPKSKPTTVSSSAPSPTVSQPSWWKPKAKPNTVASASATATVTVPQPHWWKPKPNTVASSVSQPAPVKPSLTVVSQIPAQLTVMPSVQPSWRHSKSLSGFVTVYSRPPTPPNKEHHGWPPKGHHG
ncbi:hypothetical protein ABEF93_001264 [Exophiala dermatitidis]